MFNEYDFFENVYDQSDTISDIDSNICESDFLQVNTDIIGEDSYFKSLETYENHFGNYHDLVDGVDNIDNAFRDNDSNFFIDDQITVHNHNLNGKVVSFGSSESSGDILKEIVRVEDNLHYHQKQLDVLLNDKHNGMVGIEPAIKDHEWAIKNAESELQSLHKKYEQAVIDEQKQK